jgi:hypothetical protein
MNGHDIHKIPKFDYLMLPLIMALAFYVAFIPHLNYPYPVHVDEWVHLTFSQAMLNAGSTTFANPFGQSAATTFGQPIVNLSSNPESGFHLFWGIFQRISGLSWLTIFRYFPSIILMMTVLSVYTLARREGFGWEATLFTSLIPTTIGMLGPAFLVPVATGLIFIPLAIFLAFNFRTLWSYLVMFIFTALLLAMHAATAVGLVIILAPYILLTLRSEFKHSLGITLALVIPFIAPFPWIFDLLLPTAKALFSPVPLPWYVDYPPVIRTYGYLPILLALLGTFALTLRGGRKSYGLVLGLVTMLLMLTIFFTFHYGVPIMYDRGLMYMLLMASIVAGAGLMAVKNLRLPERLSHRLRAPLVTQNVGRALCLALIGLTLVIAIPARQSTYYYHMIDEPDYEAFVWVRENVSDDYEKAILDPWKATAFSAITGKEVFTRLHSYSEPRDEQASAFIKGGCRDTSFLRQNGISIIYTRSPCQNPDLVEVRKNVYVLKEAEEGK